MTFVTYYWKFREIFIWISKIPPIIQDLIGRKNRSFLERFLLKGMLNSIRPYRHMYRIVLSLRFPSSAHRSLLPDRVSAGAGRIRASEPNPVLPSSHPGVRDALRGARCNNGGSGINRSRDSLLEALLLLIQPAWPQSVASRLRCRA